MLCIGPEAEVSEELYEGGALVVGVEAAGVGEDPGVAAAEGGLLGIQTPANSSVGAIDRLEQKTGIGTPKVPSNESCVCSMQRRQGVKG